MEGGGGLKRTKFELIFCSTIMSALTLLLYYIIIFLKKKPIYSDNVFKEITKKLWNQSAFCGSLYY